MHTHDTNYGWIQWEYPGYRLFAKTPTTLRSENSTNSLSSDAVKSYIRKQKFHLATFCNHTGTSKIIPNNQWRAKLHSRHWSPKTPTDIWTNLHYIRQKQSLHYPIAKLCATQNQHLNRRHVSLGIVDMEDTTPIPLDDNSLATICDQIYQSLPKVKKKTWTRNDIEKRCHLGAPEAYRSWYIDTLFRHQAAHGQIGSGTSKGFHPQNLPQGWWNHLPETIQLTWNSQSIHRANPRQMAET